MKIRCERDALKSALKLVASTTPRGGSLPVLHGVKIDAGKTVTLTCTDMDRTCTVDLEGAGIEDKGVALPPVALLSKVVAVLPAGAVTLELDDGENLTITAGDDVTVIRSMNPAEFPKQLPLDPDSTRIELGVEACRRIAATLVAAGHDPSKSQILMGAHFNGDTVACTDSFRLHVANLTADGYEQETPLPECIVPADFLADVLADTDDAGCSVEFTRNDARFATKSATWTTRLIPGEYPKWDNLIKPLLGKGELLEFDRDELLGAIKRICPLAEVGSTTRPIRLTQDGGKLIVSARSDRGEATAVLALRGDMPVSPVAFDWQYLTGVLEACPEGLVPMRLQDNLKPGLIETGAHTLLIMPVRV